MSERKEIALRLPEDLTAVFARVSGDVNPLHVDPQYARRTAFGRNVAHGMAVLQELLRAAFSSHGSTDAQCKCDPLWPTAQPDRPLGVPSSDEHAHSRESARNDYAVAASCSRSAPTIQGIVDGDSAANPTELSVLAAIENLLQRPAFLTVEFRQPVYPGQSIQCEFEVIDDIRAATVRNPACVLRPSKKRLSSSQANIVATSDEEHYEPGAAPPQRDSGYIVATPDGVRQGTAGPEAASGAPASLDTRAPAGHVAATHRAAPGGTGEPVP